MPLQLVPLAIGAAGFFAGSRLASSNNDAQVVVNAAPNPTATSEITRAALLGGAALVALMVVPKILGADKRR